MRKPISLLAVSLSLLMIAACSPSSPAYPRLEACAAENTWKWDGQPVKGKHTVVICTSMGDIEVELDGDAASKTVTNFMALGASGYYDNLTFHRVIPGFMIQGGDPNGNGTGGRSVYGEKFEDEIDPSSALYQIGYKEGVVAMANAGPDTNGSQFFIMDADYPLPPNFTIFGRVTQNQSVVKAIANVPRGNNDMPNEKVTMKVRIVK